jgi:hypothetical protein
MDTTIAHGCTATEPDVLPAWMPVPNQVRLLRDLVKRSPDPDHRQVLRRLLTLTRNTSEEPGALGVAMG